MSNEFRHSPSARELTELVAQLARAHGEDVRVVKIGGAPQTETTPEEHKTNHADLMAYINLLNGQLTEQAAVYARVVDRAQRLETLLCVCKEKLANVDGCEQLLGDIDCILHSRW